MMKRYFILGMAIISVGMWLIGCSGGSGGDSGSGAAPPAQAPSISTQGSLDFGVAVVGRISSRQLVISNVGTASLDIGQMSLPANSSFAISTDNCSNQSVKPQGTCSIALRLNATSQVNYSDTLTIPSNDSTKNPFAVVLTGKGRAYNLEINEVKTDGCGLVPKVLKLLVSVTDAAGIPIDVVQPEFTVVENGTQKVISNFTHPIVAPISVDLVLDYSGSLTPSDLVSIQNAAKSFVDQLVNVGDEAAVLKFALTIGSKTAFSADHDLLKTAIDAAYPGNTGGTILYDALFTAIDDTVARVNTKRAVVVFSDGTDEESTSTLTDVVDHAILEGVPIFAIAYTDATNPMPEVMQQLAQETGGEFFIAPTSADLAGIYNQIITILSQQYLIEYGTSSTGGTTVSLDVEVNSGGQLGEDSKEVIGCN